MKSNKKYWKGLEELQNSPDFVEKRQGEFSERLPIEEVLNEAGLSTVAPRRDFLKALGFGLGAVTLAACNPTSVTKSIPYLVKPEEIVPGIPNYYTSTFNGHSVLVKTREGRPIKLEGNPNCILSRGKLSAQGQAAVLDLYDVSKLKGPTYNGKSTTWPQLDQYVKGELNKVQAGGKKIRIVSSTITSPSTKAVINDFILKFPNTTHIQVDAVSYTGILKANENSFGVAVIPGYRFDKADLIVSFDADFLGSWISPTEYNRLYVSNRNSASLKNKKMSRHIQFESGMSLTGTNADTRIPLKPSEQGIALMNLYAALGGTLAGGRKLTNNPNADKAIMLVAKELAASKGKGLVVCGSNDVSTQILVNAINSLIGSYGATIDLTNASYQYAGNDAAFVEFVNEMKRGEVGAVFFVNSNPGYDFVNTKEFTDALTKVNLRVSFADRQDETASLCQVVAPAHHFLESWADANPVEGYYTIGQPTINPVNDTRYAEEGLLIWSDNAVKDYYQYLQTNWTANILPKAGSSWKELLQKGSVYLGAKPAAATAFTRDLNAVGQTILNQSNALSKGGDNAIELSLYENVAIGDGKVANNPWLQELPDPVSKVTWDNYVAIAPKYAEKLDISEFDLVEVKTDKYSVVLPVLLQPGQAIGTVSIALGYGRTKAGKAGAEVGKNAFPFLTFVNGTFQNTSAATISKAGGNYELAQTQTHHTIEGRNIIRETTLKEYLKDPHSGTGKTSHGKSYDLWDKYEQPGHNWVMAIDLNACTGCGACIVACNAENNIPVVGRDEVRRRREMHWIRIDRYYTFNEGDEKVTEENEIKHMENLDNVSVVHQPMLCQHCEHAPCETVCPVIATMHSSEGLNHMAYNRCVGTRYCANNCPYKVRRFNWFNYWNDSRFDNYMNNEFTQLVLNPDVTVRSRGVMEKCSMCIQRIQAGKLQAKLEKRPLKDGDIQVACQQTCPTNAIIFGDGNDPESAVSKALTSERTYYVLEEINTNPGIGYQTKVRNTVEA
jgi:MoCo/4Fe-4S cofactor protein with predicted Tat translocation signal